MSNLFWKETRNVGGSGKEQQQRRTTLYSVSQPVFRPICLMFESVKPKPTWSLDFHALFLKRICTALCFHTSANPVVISKLLNCCRRVTVGDALRENSLLLPELAFSHLNQRRSTSKVRFLQQSKWTHCTYQKGHTSVWGKSSVFRAGSVSAALYGQFALLILAGRLQVQNPPA